MIGTVRGMMRSKKEVAGLPAPIASFRSNASGVKLDSLKVLVEAQQDLHGYDKPWAGGGGTNKWDEQWELGTYNENTGEPQSANAIRAKNYIAVMSGETYRFINNGTDVYARIVYYDANKNIVSIVNNTISNNRTFTIPSGVYFMRFSMAGSYGTTYNNDISINYPSTVTTYSPYENICPITGWSGAVISRVGVNVWDEEVESGYYDVNDNGAPKPSGSWARCKNAIKVNSNTSYYAKASHTNFVVLFYDTNDNLISYNGALKNTAFITPVNCAYIRFYGTPSGFEDETCINYPSTDTAYHAYNGNTYTISFGDTYYGGELDVTSGVLRVLYEKYKLPSTGWVFSSNRYQKSDVLPVGEYYSDTNVMCDTYPKITLAQAGQGAKGVVMGYNSHYIYFYITEDFPTLSDWTTYLTNNDVYITRPLATPFTIQLTPQQIEQLEENNIWADTGDVSECKYSVRVDTVLFSKG